MEQITISWSEDAILCNELSPEDMGERVRCLFPVDPPGPALHLLWDGHFGKRENGEVVLWQD